MSEQALTPIEGAALLQVPVAGFVGPDDFRRMGLRAQEWSLEKFTFPCVLPGPFRVHDEGDGRFCVEFRNFGAVVRIPFLAASHQVARRIGSTIYHRSVAAERISGPGVYLVKCERFIKIGMGRSVGRRLEALQTANPLELELLSVLSTRTHDERPLHLALKSFRVHGEWFRAEDSAFRVLAEALSKLEAS